MFSPDCDARAIAEEHARWNRQHAQPLKRKIKPHRNERNPDRRLRLGYRGRPADPFRGAVSAPLLENHNRSAFEVFCYANVSKPDSMTDRLARHPMVGGASRASVIHRRRTWSGRMGSMCWLILCRHRGQPVAPLCPQAGPGAGDVSGVPRHHGPGDDRLPHHRSVSRPSWRRRFGVLRAIDPPAGNVLVLPGHGLGTRHNSSTCRSSRAHHIWQPEQFVEDFRTFTDGVEPAAQGRARQQAGPARA